MPRFRFFRWGVTIWPLVSSRSIIVIDLTHGWRLWYSRRHNSYQYLILSVGPVHFTWTGGQWS